MAQRRHRTADRARGARARCPRATRTVRGGSSPPSVPGRPRHSAHGAQGAAPAEHRARPRPVPGSAGRRRVGSSRCAGALRGGDRSGHPGGRSPVLRHGMGRRSQRARRLAERVPRRLVPRRRRRRAARHVGLVPRRARRGAPRRPRRTGDRVRRTARRASTCWATGATRCSTVIDQSVGADDTSRCSTGWPTTSRRRPRHRRHCAWATRAW